MNKSVWNEIKAANVIDKLNLDYTCITEPGIGINSCHIAAMHGASLKFGK